MQQPTCFKTVATTLAGRTRCYLADQASIEVMDVQTSTEDVDHLTLRHTTAIIGLGGLLIAFSFPREMIDVLYERLTADIEIPVGQEAVYRDAAVTEAANVIAGNCTADLAGPGERIALSPPVLLEDARQIHRLKNAMFGTVSINTRQGSFDIHMVGPRDMFDARLNYES
jgi:CheY-specific phosphatase CheX